MAKTSLFAITEEFEALDEMLQQDQGEICETFEELEKFMVDLLQEKTDGCVNYVSSLTAEIAAADVEIKKMQDFMKVRKNAISNFKNYMMMCMNKLKVDKFSGDFHTIARRKGVDKVKIVEEKKIPIEFLKTTVSIKAADVKAALKSGEVVPGAMIVKGDDSIQMKTRGVK